MVRASDDQPVSIVLSHLVGVNRLFTTTLIRQQTPFGPKLLVTNADTYIYRSPHLLG